LGQICHKMVGEVVEAMSYLSRKEVKTMPGLYGVLRDDVQGNLDVAILNKSVGRGEDNILSRT